MTVVSQLGPAPIRVALLRRVPVAVVHHSGGGGHVAPWVELCKNRPEMCIFCISNKENFTAKIVFPPPPLKFWETFIFPFTEMNLRVHVH